MRVSSFSFSCIFLLFPLFRCRGVLLLSGTPMKVSRELSLLLLVHLDDINFTHRSPYRRDLGGLLFSQAVSSLRSRYCNDDEEEEVEKTDNTNEMPVKCNKCGGSHHKHLYDVQCTLDAEEDVTRHGKLVNFYGKLTNILVCYVQRMFRDEILSFM